MSSSSQLDFKDHLLIGIAGKKHVGKSSSAKYLVVSHGFRELAFADRLKAGCSAIFGWTYLSMFDQDVKELEDPELGFSRRQAMQTVGQAARDKLGEDVWVKLMQRDLQHRTELGYPICISDIRFENEAQLVRNLGGYIIHLRREQAFCDDDHLSEKGLYVQKTDYVIENHSDSISSLHSSLDHILQCIKLRRTAGA